MDKHLQLLLQLRDKVTAPLRGIEAVSGQTSDAFKAARDQLKQLQGTAKDIEGFRTTRAQLRGQERDLQALQAKLASTNTSFNEHRERHKNIVASLKTAREAHKRLTAALQDGAQASPEFIRQLELARITLLSSQGAYERSSSALGKYRKQIKTTQTDIAQLTGKIGHGRERLQGYEQRLDKAGISTQRLGQQARSYKTQIQAATTATDQHKDSLAKLKVQQERMDQLKASHAKTMLRTGMAAGAGAGMKAVGQRIAQTGLRPVDAFMQHEDAMMGVQRQLPGARDAQGNLTGTYRQAEKEIRQLSERLPQTTAEIADMYTAAARMEVPVQHLGMFTELASEMGSAFDAPANDVAESMGKIANNLQIPITEIRAMADTINYLDDNAISKGSDIIGFLNRVGGVAGSVKISGQDMAALGSTLLTSGETEETAGTAVKAIFTNFAAATKGTKKFQKALGEIGLTATQVQGGMAKDAVGTLLQVAQAIKSIPEKDRLGIMAELVGKEHVGKMAKLVTNTEELRRQIELANSAEAQGSMAREAAARNSALSAQLQMQKNRMFNAMAIAGEALKQPILQLLKAINPLIERFTQWMQANPALVSGILQTVVAAGALLAVLGTIGMGLAAALGPLFLARFFLARFALNLSTARLAAQAAAPAVGLLSRALGGGLPQAASAAARAVPAALTRIGLAIQAPARGGAVLWKKMHQWLTVPAGQPSRWERLRKTLAAFPDAAKAMGRRMKDAAVALPDASIAAWGRMKDGIAAAGKATGHAYQRLKAYIALQAAAALGAGKRGAAAMVLRGPAGLAKDAAGALASLAGKGIAGTIAGIGGALLKLKGIIMVVGRAMFMNPIGLALTAIAGAALLIIKYWQPIKAFFTGFWQGFTQGLAPLSGMFSGIFGGLGNMLAPLRPVWDWLVGAFAAAWGWVSRLFAPIEHTKESLHGATEAGRGFGAWLAGLVVTVAQLVGQFFNWGADIVRGLINGMLSGVGAVVDTVAGIAAKIKGVFTGDMQIKSPSRVFMQYGGFIGQGAAIGMEKILPTVSTAALALAGAVALPMQAQTLAVPQASVQLLNAAQHIQVPKAAVDLANAQQTLAVPISPMTPMAPATPRAGGVSAAPAAGGNTYQITIHAAPGMDAQAVARAVAAELDRRDRAAGARRQSALHDMS